MTQEQIDVIKAYYSTQTTDEIQPNFDDVKVVADNIDDVINVSSALTDDVFTDINANLADIITTATNVEDVVTTSNNITDVNTVANELNQKLYDGNTNSSIEVVANDIANVNSVAPYIQNVNITASNIADVNTTATNISDVVNVSGSIDSVNTTANDIANINTVATDVASVVTTANNISDVNTTASNINSVQTVAQSINDVNSVALDLTNIDTVANDITNVSNVGSNINSVNAVANNIANVNTTATNILDVSTVAQNIDSINALVDENTGLATLISNQVNVDTVANDIANVNTVATNIADVNSVATNISNVNSVALNETNINAVVTDVIPNMAEILQADDNATTATTQAGIATTKANEASASASNASTSEANALAYRNQTEAFRDEVSGYVDVLTPDNYYTKSETETKIVELAPAPTKAGIEALAINASSLTQDSNNRLVTDTEKDTWNDKYTKAETDAKIVELAPTPDLSGLVDLTTAQNVGGVKTFTSFPVTPSTAPTSDYQVANKKYVDDNAGAEIATATEIRTGTDNTKAISPLGYNQTTLGWGQTRQDVTASRSAGVTYTNTTGKPIFIKITSNASEIVEFTLYVDGNIDQIVKNRTISGSSTRCTAMQMILNNSTYRVVFSSGSVGLWTEIR